MRPPRYPWEDWQEIYIREASKRNVSSARIAKMLGRSAVAVRLKLMRMKGECFTQSQSDQKVSACFGETL